MDKLDIKNFSEEELKNFLQKEGQEPFRARQIFCWIYQRGIEDFSSMSDLSRQLRQALNKNFSFSALELAQVNKSQDGTQKFIFKLADKSLIESALIPAEKRNTACLSTQVGCKFCCKFCASGISGFKRNLSTGEIISQVLFIKKNLPNIKISHLVFMGTGEPLDNYDNVLKAARIFNSKDGMNIAARRITISTSGIIPGIKKLSRENLQVELSVSLHASDNQARNLLMPINKKYPLEELIPALRDYFRATRRQVTFEYILIHNLNCGLEDVKKLGRILKGFDFKFNLIPYNKIREFAFEPPAKLEVLFFRGQLSKEGIRSTLRMPRGKDINAACGQLRYYAEAAKLPDYFF